MIISILFCVITLLTGYLTLFLSKTQHKAYAYFFFVFAFIVTWQQTLGIARPSDLNVTHKKGQLIAHKLDEPNAIYIWVSFDRNVEPLSMQLPWSKEQAKQLYEAEKKHQKMLVEMPSITEKVKQYVSSLLNPKNAKQQGPNTNSMGEPRKQGAQEKQNLTKSTRDQDVSSKPTFYPDMTFSLLPPKVQIDN